MRILLLALILSGAIFAQNTESGLCNGKHENTGCYIGVEVGYAPSVRNEMVVKVKAEQDAPYNFTHKLSAIPLNAILGYQWYFLQSMGLRFQARVGYATYNSKSVYTAPELDKFEAIAKSSALHYGVDVEYLYDFVHTQNHALGLDIAAGVDFAYFMKQEFGFKISDKSEFGANEQNFKLDKYSKISPSFSLGIHYFYKSHQFGLKYRYLAYNTQKKMNKTIGDSVESSGNVSYATGNLSALLFSYTYRF